MPSIKDHLCIEGPKIEMIDCCNGNIPPFLLYHCQKGVEFAWPACYRWTFYRFSFATAVQLS